MNKLTDLLLSLTLTFSLAYGCSSGKSPVNTISQTSITNEISNSLGITSSQTEAGLGAMMMLSRNKLSPDNFNKLSKSIPGGANNLINKATGLGVIPGSLGTTTDIVTALEKLGVSPTTAAKFVPEVLNLSKTFGGDAFGLLSKVF